MKSSEVIKLNTEGKQVSGDKKVGNTFNTFFTSIAQTLANKLGQTSANHSNFLISPISDEDSGEVKSKLMNLDES